MNDWISVNSPEKPAGSALLLVHVPPDGYMMCSGYDLQKVLENAGKGATHWRVQNLAPQVAPADVPSGDE